MATNGKNKGNTFERKIANLLSKRFESKLGMQQGFRRNPDSGSFFGGTNRARVNTHNTELASFGDLICPTTFLYSVECKHYKTAPTFTAIVAGNVKQWDGWISQAQQDARNSNRQMLLIVKYNGVDEIVFVEQENKQLTLKLVYKGLFVYTLDDFLSQVDTTFFADSITA